jgi:hypothetical protein
MRNERAGEWRGRRVALKTTVFEVTRDACMPPSGGRLNAGGGVGADGDVPTPLAAARAVMEAGIAASVRHRNVVRLASRCRHHASLSLTTRSITSPLHLHLVLS